MASPPQSGSDVVEENLTFIHQKNRDNVATRCEISMMRYEPAESIMGRAQKVVTKA